MSTVGSGSAIYTPMLATKSLKTLASLDVSETDASPPLRLMNSNPILRIL